MSTWKFLGAVVALVCSVPAFGSFHLMQVEQVIGGVNGDMTAQAIQLRMRSDFQNILSNARLVVRDAAGANPIVISDPAANVAVRGVGVRVLICTPSFVPQTSPPAVPDFTITTPIPASYFTAGTLEFQNNAGSIIYWRVSWGGAGYTGLGTGSTSNDVDGNFNPPFPGPLQASDLRSIRFGGAAAALSTNNAADYALSASPSVWVNNAGTSFTLQGVALEACCLPGGTCMELPAANCTGMGGTPQGPGSNCASNPCAPANQACCFSSGTCQDLPAAACVMQGGTAQGPGTSCAGTVCMPETVACCFPTGVCMDLPDTACAGQGGLPGAPGSSCGAQMCPVLVQACCFPDGNCEDQLPSDCINNGGTPRGEGTSCGKISCEVTRSCCLPDGTCDNLTYDNCVAACGLPGPVDSFCTAPACCVGDFNGDGTRSLADIAVAIQNWSAPFGLCHLAQITQNWDQPCAP